MVPALSGALERASGSAVRYGGLTVSATDNADPMTGRIVQSGLWEGFEVISEYGDHQAVEDGVLIDISGRLNPNGEDIVSGARATVGIFSAFCELARKRADVTADEVDDVSRLACQLLYRAVMRKPADADGWRKTEARSDGESMGEVWLVPNENGAGTLMFPSDY